MTENLDINLEKYCKQQRDALMANPLDHEAMLELVCADALLCEENLKYMGPDWKNAALCQEIVQYMPQVLEHAQALGIVANLCDRAAQALYDHPRLKLALLRYERQAIEQKGDEDGLENDLKHVDEEIKSLEHNIKAADAGDFCSLRVAGHLKHDPVEWTEPYERAIAHAKKKANEKLADHPRGMGFCFAYWSALAEILHDDYGIAWRNPHIMNPRVIFD